MSCSTNLVEIIPDGKNLLGVTISELVDEMLKFKNKILILFDLETLGLNPKYEYEQITEIAAFSVCGNTMQILDKFNFKINLSKSAIELLNNSESVQRYNWESRQKKRGKYGITDPNEILKMTHYYETNAEVFSEKVAIEKFFEFVNKYNNVILVAHNAKFDVNFIKTRGSFYGMDVPLTEILDTLKISQFFFVPAIQTSKSTNSVEILNKLSRINKLSTHISSRLGDLADAFSVNSSNWHSASADVEMMYEVMNKMIEYLNRNKKLNIKKKQHIAILKTIKNKSNLQKKRKNKRK